MPTARQQRIAEAALFAAGVAYGASTPLARVLHHSLTPVMIVALRFFFAIPFSFVASRSSARKIDVSLWRLLPLLVYLPAGVWLFTLAILSGRIAVAIFGFYLSNLLSALVVGVLRNGERVDRPTVAAFGFSFLAASLFALGSPADNGSTVKVFALAIASGLFATAFAQEQKNLGSRVDGATLTLLQLSGGVVVAAIVAIVARDTSVSALTVGGWAVAVLYGFMLFAIGRLQVFGFRDAPVGLGTVLLSVEVAVGPLMAFVFFGETLSTLEIAGGACTAAAVIATARRSAT